MATKKQYFVGAIVLIFILLVVFSGSAGLKGILSGVGLFKSGSPDDLISGHTELSIKPAFFKLSPENVGNLSIGALKVANFQGVVAIDFEKGKVSISDVKKELEAETELVDFSLTGIRLGGIEIKDTELKLKSGKWDISTQNGSVDISDFSGDVSVSSAGVEFRGNATGKIRK